MAEIKPRDIPATTPNMVITCMDPRFHKITREILMKDYEVDIDESSQLSMAGSSKAVVDGTLIPQIEKSYELHELSNVYIVDHSDCGGFGGLKAFGGEESKEIESHGLSLARAKDAINKVLPKLVVTTFLVNLDGEKVLPK